MQLSLHYNPISNNYNMVLFWAYLQKHQQKDSGDLTLSHNVQKGT